ncbi:MAG: hypothetical protein ACLVJH_04550 [Faecalibacterium prausnitzii]
MDVTPLEEDRGAGAGREMLALRPHPASALSPWSSGAEAPGLTLEDIPAGKVKDYLLASAACFPALRAQHDRRGAVPGWRLPGQYAHRAGPEDGRGGAGLC